MPKIIIASVVAAIVVGAGAVYLLFGGSIETTPEPQPTAFTADTVVSPDDTTTGFSTLSGLAGLGRNLECTVQYEPENDPVNTVTGTYFTSNGNVRGDFIVPGLPEGSVSSLIFSGETVYSWSVIEGEAYGVTIDAATWQALTLNPESSGTQTPIPATASLAYSCAPWVTVDGSIFIPPSDILFKEYETVMQSGMEYGTVYEENGTTVATQCALCEKIAPGEGQNQCRNNFKCVTE